VGMMIDRRLRLACRGSAMAPAYFLVRLETKSVNLLKKSPSQLAMLRKKSPTAVPKAVGSFQKRMRTNATTKNKRKFFQVSFIAWRPPAPQRGCLSPPGSNPTDGIRLGATTGPCYRRLRRRSEVRCG